MYMLTNGIQQTEDFNNFKSNHFAAIVKPIGKVTWTTNYYFGQEQPDGDAAGRPGRFFRVFDTYVAYDRDVEAELRAGRELRHQRSEQGRSTRCRCRASASMRAIRCPTSGRAVGCATNGSTTKGSSAASSRCSHEVTATAEYKFADGFLVRGEFRRDWSNERFFTSRARVICATSRTRPVGLVWWFGNKAGAW